jgi:hypothetical protein
VEALSLEGRPPSPASGTKALVFSLAPTGATLASAPAFGSVQPTTGGGLDCNGFSPRYKLARPGMVSLCTDPISVYDGHAYRFKDNGHYIRHDEPSTSSHAGCSVLREAVMPTEGR